VPVPFDPETAAREEEPLLGICLQLGMAVAAELLHLRDARRRAPKRRPA